MGLKEFGMFVWYNLVTCKKICIARVDDMQYNIAEMLFDG